jgi:hypothetical protein
MPSYNLPPHTPLQSQKSFSNDPAYNAPASVPTPCKSSSNMMSQDDSQQQMGKRSFAIRCWTEWFQPLSTIQKFNFNSDYSEISYYFEKKTIFFFKTTFWLLCSYRRFHAFFEKYAFS